jgi:hypothetical protein
MMFLKSLKSQWSFYLFLLTSVWGILRLLLADAEPGHYLMFTQAARELWLGIDPHGKDWGTGLGHWFYSPSCGLFYFSLFAYFPWKLGLFLYLSTSVLVFILGVRAFFKAIGFSNVSAGFVPTPIFHWFWILSIQPILIGILYTKLEILMVGLLFFGAAALLSGRYLGVSAFLLAMTLNWKYLPLPILALWTLTCVCSTKSNVENRRWPLLLMGSILFWYALPFLFHPWEFMVEMLVRSAETLTPWLAQLWDRYENIYSFLVRVLGFPLKYEHVYPLAIVAGGLMAAAIIAFRKLWSWQDLILSSFAFGTLFSVCFSPFSQGNGVIYGAPLVAVLIVQSAKTHELVVRNRLNLFLFVSFLVTLLYSDFSAALGYSLRDKGLKSFWFLIMGLVYCHLLTREERRGGNRGQ